MGWEGNTGEEKVDQMIGTQDWSQGNRYLISCDLLGNVRSTGTNSGGGNVCSHSLYPESWVPGRYLLMG